MAIINFNMAKKKTAPKKPKAPKTAPLIIGIDPPPIILEQPTRPVKLPTPKPLTKAYDCKFSTKKLTFYLLEVEGPASSKNAGPFTFKYAPRNISWKKQVNITEYKTQGNISQPVYFSSAANKRLALNDIIFDGHDGVLPHDQLNRLQLLQLPAKGTTKLRVFQLLVGNLEGKRFAARSYGNYIINSLDIIEQFRDPATGLTLRAKVNLELLEIANYQLDLGNDLAIPTTIVPTLPKELSGAVNPKGELSTGQERVTGEAIPAGQTIAYVGYTSSRNPQMAAHLHFQYTPKNLTKEKAGPKYAALNINTPGRTYPKEILDLITLGPHKYKNVSSPAKKLSELKLDTEGGGLMVYRKKTKSYHYGVDYQLPGLSGREGMLGCPIVMNVPCSWVGVIDKGDGCYRWEVSEPGLDGYVSICHISRLAQVSGTHNKKASSKSPLNTGGTTEKAIKKKNDKTND